MKKLVLHLGAHRCGSTAIQSLLRREHTALAGEGIGVFLRADMETGGFDLRRLHRYRSLNPVWRSKLTKTARAVEMMQQQTLVVSEENIMGTMPAVRSSQFYPHFSSLVQSLVKLSQLMREPLTIAPRLVVRRQDHYLESVYAFRVARGLAVGFDDFVKAATRTRISWLKLVRSFDGVPSSIELSVGILEAWPKPTAGAKALEFLIGDNTIDLSQRRLTGNTRRSALELGFMLAMNRAKIDWRGADWMDDVLGNLQADGGGKTAAEYALKESLNAAAYKRFERYYSSADKLGFDDQQRGLFIESYREENKQFLQMDIVRSPVSVWS